MTDLIPVGGDLFSAYRHFDLAEEPFAARPDSRFLFNSTSYADALEQLALAASHDRVTVITGAAGTGKTLACRQLADRITSDTRVSVIENSQLGTDALFRQMLHDLGAADSTSGRRPFDALDGEALVTTLRHYLESLISCGAHAVLVMDAAERLRPSLLVQLYALSTSQTGSGTLLQIILVGRQNLDLLLEAPELRPLRQRVSRRHRLAPLAASEVEPYLERRLWVAHGGTTAAAGGEGSAFWRVQFTAAATRAVAALSDGNPRAINALAEQALEAAATRLSPLIDVSDVVAAAQQLELAIPFRVKVASRRRLAAAALLVIAVGGLTASRLLNPLSGSSDPPPRTNVVAGSGPTAAASEVRASIDPGGSPEATVGPLVAIESFTVVAASFRSPERAAELAGRLTEVGLPVYTRAASGPWHLVVVGPYATRDEALTAQRQLGAAQVKDSKIVATPPSA